MPSNIPKMVRIFKLLIIFIPELFWVISARKIKGKYAKLSDVYCFLIVIFLGFNIVTKAINLKIIQS